MMYNQTKQRFALDLELHVHVNLTLMESDNLSLSLSFSLSLFLTLWFISEYSLILQSYQTSNVSSTTVRNAAYGYNSDNDQVNTVTVPVNSAYSEVNDGMVNFTNYSLLHDYSFTYTCNL